MILTFKEDFHMDLSVFLAKVMGLYLVIVSIALFVRSAQLKRAISEIVEHPGLTLLSGIIALIFGLMVVVSHNVWIMAWPVVVTLMGWLMLVKGVLRIAFPDVAMSLGSQLTQNRNVYNTVLLIAFLVGVYLSYAGLMI